MKIFLPFKPRMTGGTSIFVDKFREKAEILGHRVTLKFEPDYEVMLLVVQAPFKYVMHAALNRKLIVQRLDGVNYWSVAGPKFPILNLKGMIIRHLFATSTIYQSEYSKYCCNLFLGKKYREISTIIYNGVNTNIFNPNGNIVTLRDNPDQHILINASDYRRIDQVEPIIESTKIYIKKYHSNTKLILIGNFRGNAKKVIEKHKNNKFLVLLGPIQNNKLAVYLRSSDVFLHTHQNPACPNNVIEAMACGLPICGVSDGAMPELINISKNGYLIPANGNGFWIIRKLDYPEIAKNIATCIKSKSLIKEINYREVKLNYNLDVMVNKYLNFIKDCNAD